MFEASQAFHRARGQRDSRPVLLFSLINAFGQRVYAPRHPRDEELGLLAPARADGTFLADGLRRAGEGSLNLVDRGAWVISMGRLRETLSPLGGELLASLSQEEPGKLSVVLGNPAGPQGRVFSRMEACENLLGATGEVIVGFQGLAAREYLRRFQGRVSAYALQAERLILTVEAM